MRRRTVLASGAAIAALASFLVVSALAPPASGVNPPPSYFVYSDTVLTQDLNESVVMGASNITLDCGGHQVSYPGAKIGILIENLTSVTVENCVVTGFETGYVLVDATNITLANDTALRNSMDGFLVTSTGNRLVGDNASTNGGSGFSIASRNLLDADLALGNAYDGFHVNALNAVNGSVALGDGNDGFSVLGSGNVLTATKRPRTAATGSPCNRFRTTASRATWPTATCSSASP